MTYPLYPTRQTQQLDGVWDAAWLGEVAADGVDCDAIDWDVRLAVPGVFDSTPALAGRRGCLAYRQTLTAVAGQPGLLRFGGGGLQIAVYVDGQLLHVDRRPYTGFNVAVPASQATSRNLVVVVDNRFAATPLFDQFFDFYAYGGLYRSVCWEQLPEWGIDRVRVKTLTATGGQVRLQAFFRGNTPATVSLQYGFDDAELLHAEVAVQNGCATWDAEVPDPQRWSPASPALHRLQLQVNGDCLVERFGLRLIGQDQGLIALDGQPVKLLGFCRHEAHPQFGPALPLQQLIDDLQILKDLGCNFIRGAHYPQDQRFLDLCDEMGFLVFEESLGWGQRVEPHFVDSEFCDLQVSQTEAMVHNSANHPCVIIWGYLNEGDSKEDAAADLYGRLTDCLRAADDGRLITYATMFAFDDKHLDLCDVISANIYPGWYAHDDQQLRPLEEIEQRIDALQEHLRANGQGDKPLLISEIGAGAIYGWRDHLHAHWSEEYQADHLGIVCRRVRDDAGIAGVSLWQYCDCRTYSSAIALKRPRAFNNKGLLDEYRRAKMAYQTVKTEFTQVQA